MAPLVDNDTKLIKEHLQNEHEQFQRLVAPSADNWKFRLHPIIFPYVLGYNLLGFYGGYLLLYAKYQTVLFTLFLVIPSMLGLGAGVHRLWSHRAFKVKPQLEILLIFFYLLTNQRSIVTWARRHRLHHQCADTDADPHNATRGFFFSQYGWMVVEPHPEVVKREKHIDVSDLMKNPIIRFQEKYIVPLVALIAFGFPTFVATTFWGESLHIAFFVNYFRTNLVMNMINLINSAAHLIGYKPIDQTAVGTQSQGLGLIIFGEGFHNYHHTFPYDYRSSEFGDIKYNLSALFIEFMAKIGWAYDLKVTSENVIRNRVLKKGDGTDMYYIPNNQKKQDFFGTNYFKPREQEKLPD
ncbi:(11Z)-hexadec-11-enoyl-CoA conjugase [Amyelois transitella]|uniref:(11Z)-hexadec-11-enoyl-CoA conjugase n=1 Tax=Amyelois transitella TaxID=680683 RepID=UPI00067C6E11|nr:(11Z)-hexadec-11-enoyl-CoA conjugase [Amyelois transitella]